MLVSAARGLTSSSESGCVSLVRGRWGPTLAAELSPEIRAAVVPRLAEVEALNQRIAA